jgi:hypothetical protein
LHFFALSVTTSLKIPGAVIPRRVFTRPGSLSTESARAARCRLYPSEADIRTAGVYEYASRLDVEISPCGYFSRIGGVAIGVDYCWGNAREGGAPPSVKSTDLTDPRVYPLPIQAVAGSWPDRRAVGWTHLDGSTCS